MPLKKCFDNAPKEIKDEFDKRVKEGMSIREVREIGTQILDSHFRDIFEGMENLKNIVDPSYKKKEFVSPLKDVSDIDKIYDDRLKELDGMDEEIENAKKEEEDREDEKEEVKPKSESKLPGQIHKGKKFMHAGSQWEVISQDGDGWKIRSGNVVTYVDDGTLKLVISRGKIRRKEVAEKYKEDLKKAFPGASDGAINKIYAALKDKSITKKQWDQRVRDILAEDRGLGSAMDIAARYSVSALPENVRGVDSQSVIDKTKSVDAQVVKDMKEAAEFSVKQSIESMGRDGRVSFLDLRSDKNKANFPAGNMGQRLFMEDFDEVSPARVSAGSQLIDIIVAGNQRQKGMAAAYAIANRIISGESGFVTKLFGKVAKKIRITYNNQHKVVDEAGAVVAVFESANAAEQYVSRNLDQQYVIQYPNIISAIESDGGTIVLNAAKLGERMADFAGENRFFNWAEAAIYEELIHFATFKVATDAEIIKIGKELTKEQRKYVQKVYGGSTFVVKKDGKVYKYFRSEYDAEEYIKSRGEEGYEIDTISSLNDYQLGAEYVRMMVQHSITGTTTEMFKPNYTVRSVLAKLIQYLKNILKSSKDSLASKVISRIEEFIKGDQAAEKPSASRPKISMVAPDVYRVSVDDKQSFIQKRAGGIYQVVQTKEGV
jgi:glutathione peroxidase-family protein